MRNLLVVALLAGCGGGGSGVDGGKTLGTLTSADVMSLCTYFFDNYPPRMITCSSTDMRTLGEKSVADCVTGLQQSVTNNPNCTATVANAENCIADEYAFSDAQVCMATALPASCAPLEAAGCSN